MHKWVGKGQYFLKDVCANKMQSSANHLHYKYSSFGHFSLLFDIFVHYLFWLHFFLCWEWGLICFMGQQNDLFANPCCIQVSSQKYAIAHDPYTGLMLFVSQCYMVSEWFPYYRINCSHFAAFTAYTLAVEVIDRLYTNFPIQCSQTSPFLCIKTSFSVLR